MASKRITSSRLLLSSPPPTSPSLSSDLLKLSSNAFQKSSSYVDEEEEGYRIALEHIHLRLLQDKFTGCMVPPFFVSVAGSLMKCKSTYLGFSEARLNSDVAALSNGRLSKYQHISALRVVPASQISLLWRTPWTYTTFGRAYASTAESRAREIRVSDEVDDEDDSNAEGSSEFEEGSDVEDEQRIEDSDEEEEEEDQPPQSQVLAKKKIQTNLQKSKPPDQQGRLLNQKITARTLRLVNDDGKGHRIVSRDEALTLAKGKKMDLVQVDGRANPPVCKIYDFNKEEYKQEQVLKDRKKQKGAMARLNEVKELRFNSKTESKDLKMKVEQAKEFMNRGYRVKFVAMFKGKPDDELKRLEEEKMIDAILPMMEEVAAIEQGPRVESRQAWVMLRHLKFSKKKPPKRESQTSVTEEIERVKHKDQAFSEPDFYQEQEENVMHAQRVSSSSEAAAMGSLQGYSGKLTSPLSKPFAFHSPHLQMQPLPRQDIVEAFSSEKYSPPLHGFPQDTQSFQGFGGSQGSERAVSPPPDLLPSISTSQRAGVQAVEIQSLQPSVSPRPASSSQRNDGAQIRKPQSSPLDGMSPLQSKQHPSPTPEVQRLSMPPHSPGILSQKQPSSYSPRLEKAIGSEVSPGEYPALSSGRGIAPPNQPPHSSFSLTPPTSLRGSPSNIQGPLLNLSGAPPTPPATHMHGPSNHQDPLLNASPSFLETSSHQGSLSNLESPLADFFASPPPPTPHHAPSSSQGSHPYSSLFVPNQNIQKGDSPTFRGSEGLPPRGVPLSHPSPLHGFPPRGVPRYPPPPIGQPRYTSPLGQPNLQRPQGEFAPSNQNQQRQGPDFMHQMQPPPQPALDAAAPDFPQQQSHKPEQGQDKYAPASNFFFGSPQRPQQGSPNPFGSPQSPQQGSSNLFGASDFPQQQHYKPEQGQDRYASAPNSFGSSQRPQQGPLNLFGSPQSPQQGPSNLFGAPDYPQQGAPNLFRPPQWPQQGPPNPFGFPQRPQQGPPSPQHPQQGSPNLFGPPLRPQQGPPNLGRSPLRPQQGPPNLFGSPPRPQQEPSNLFGSQPYSQQGPPEPSQSQFGYQPVGVPQGPRHGGPWLSQQATSRHPSPMLSHPQQTGQPPSQGHQGNFAQQGTEGGDQNYWQSQASQGYAPQQNQAPQGYPPQRGFPQTRPGQAAFGFQGNHMQNQAAQQPPPPRGFPQTRPAGPSPPGYRPAWSAPPQSQEYAPLFESLSDKS